MPDVHCCFCLRFILFFLSSLISINTLFFLGLLHIHPSTLIFHLKGTLQGLSKHHFAIVRGTLLMENSISILFYNL